MSRPRNKRISTPCREPRARAVPAERLCEAYFCIGEKFNADGDAQSAAEYFRNPVDEGVTEFVEDEMARRRLASPPPR